MDAALKVEIDRLKQEGRSYTDVNHYNRRERGREKRTELDEDSGSSIGQVLTALCIRFGAQTVWEV